MVIILATIAVILAQATQGDPAGDGRRSSGGAIIVALMTVIAGTIIARGAVKRRRDAREREAKEREAKGQPPGGA